MNFLKNISRNIWGVLKGAALVVLFPALCGVLAGAIVGIVAAFGGYDQKPMKPVTAPQLLELRGANLSSGNQLASIKLINIGKVTGSSTVILGFGGGSVHGSTSLGLLVGIRLHGKIQLLVVRHWELASVNEASARTTYVVSKPQRELWFHAVGQPITKVYNGRDDDGYRKMGLQGLVNSKLVIKVRLWLDPKTFASAFGGVS